MSVVTWEHRRNGCQFSPFASSPLSFFIGEMLSKSLA